ncbi:MAG: hypothetical protein HOP33_13805 [Verrucomicrobia bacterium]|nr:hypothetical protein [Verrucomicrobiota bacterium]
MKPIVNLEETPGKVVGRRLTGDYSRLVSNAKSLMPRLPFPKGAFRFHSHEEADAWMDKHILQGAIRKARARQNQAT